MNLGRFYGTLGNGSNAERASTFETVWESDGVDFPSDSDVCIANNQDQMNALMVRDEINKKSKEFMNGSLHLKKDH